MIPGLLPIFLHGCEIKPGNGLVYAVHQTLPSLAEVGLACETRDEANVVKSLTMFVMTCDL